MNFIAIDFETANEKRDSACSLGLTVVKQGQIIEQKYYLIKPKELRFNPINISIHGIRAEQVKKAKEFHEIWPEILPYFTDTIVMAHNAAFDFSVLRYTLDAYQIPYPTLQYGCTMIMSRNFFNYLDNAKLNTVSHHLGLEFNHHHASSDSYACANIVLKIQEELQTSNFNELCAQTGITLGKIYPNGYTPAKTLKKSRTSSRVPIPSLLSRYSLKTDFFKEKTVVFTGTLKSMSRFQAIELVSALGGTIGQSVTKKTNVLVIPHQNVSELHSYEMSTKLKRAIELMYRGQEIIILSESDFLAQLNT